ncbi:WbqC family protein [Hymenobacter busanensis]|uniref:WbqC family protein n=1 Tax=Hymenobacter busanensis TaxID=2607656 RepID=A0A7L4ZWT0_9BACT|nr:WbqC family protein [Hymenobacter busanensis]KAA9332358.1 WbqC family protein [Hymenobacter busanensis]QHJ07305.1 hypothetical protein GUY19_08425 [Hymenobacter busanensis]
MRIAVMQPYLFPYLGYFQLLNAVDVFVLLDDVNYIKKGWINRNRLLLNGQEFLFTVPLTGSSQHKLIKDLHVAPDDRAKRKLLATVEQAYRAAPHHQAAIALLSDILHAAETRIAHLVRESLGRIGAYVGYTADIRFSSDIPKDASLTGQARILAICHQLGAREYVNPAAGADLYNAADFARGDVKLRFLQPQLNPYPQFGPTFVAGLSVLDLLMHCAPSVAFEHMQRVVVH